jgi:hypothetical protein
VRVIGMGVRKLCFMLFCLWVSFWLGNHVLLLSAVGGRLEGVLTENKKIDPSRPPVVNFSGFEPTQL